MKFEQLTLPNGARVVLCNIPSFTSVTTTILFGVGSRYEKREIGGISHFLEHMMFKGTTRRPTTLEISKELDGLGADYNAFTSKEITCYYIKLASKHVDTAIDMMQDMLKNSTHDLKEIERERGVIIEEINMYEDNPAVMVEETMEEQIIGDVPLGWNTAGTKATVRATDRAKIRAYFKKYYKPNNMVIGVVGKFDRDSVVAQIKQHFEDLPRGVVPAPKKAPKLAVGPRVHLKFKKTEQAHLSFGMQGYPYGHKDAYALRLLSVVLGGNMSSRLFINIRERQGLCYRINSSITTYADLGLFTIYGGLDVTRVEQAIAAILAELRKLKEEGIEVDELAKAKEYLKGKIALSLEESEAISGWLLEQEYFSGKIETPDEKYAKIDAVTMDDIRRVISECISSKHLLLSILGPYKNKAKFEKIVKAAGL